MPDVVLWDSHPLALGATPKQVIIDGILQFPHVHSSQKPASHQRAPSTPNFDRETADTLKYEGLPPLKSKPHYGIVAFTNVSRLWVDDSNGSVSNLFSRHAMTSSDADVSGVAIVSGGHLICSGVSGACEQYLAGNAHIIDLHGGAIQPGLVNYGANLGMTEIAMEPSTGDGPVSDPLTGGQPAFFGAGGYIARASDGLQFGTRDALYVRSLNSQPRRWR